MSSATGQFKRDFKRDARGPHRATLDSDFLGVLGFLLWDELLAERHWDHPLTGEWKDHRDCHIKLDLVLIY